MSADSRMPPKDALRGAFTRREAQGDVVITTMATARDWMTMPQQPLDVVFVPSAMGHATSLGLGIALAQPERRVIVCNGDGSMLMNLGSLVSIAGAGATNLVVLVFDNGVYEVTGAQPTPGLGLRGLRGDRARRGIYVGLRVRRARRYGAAKVESILERAGSGVRVAACRAGDRSSRSASPGPAAERARQLADALRS